MLEGHVKDYKKYAQDAHTASAEARIHSTQARESSDNHSRDLAKMQRAGNEAAQTLRRGQQRQRKREARRIA